MEDLHKNRVVEADPQAVRKGIAKSRMEINKEDASFDKLQGFFQALKEANPGTVAEIETVDSHFSMAFLCPGPCARAWTHCPKITALDGTHWTSPFNGVVVVATAMDGEGQFFPIAFGFSQYECNQSWLFFVQHLANAPNIHDTPPTMISDPCKGIDSGVSEFLQATAHSYCAFHNRQNTLPFGKWLRTLSGLANASTLGQ